MRFFSIAIFLLAWNLALSDESIDGTQTAVETEAETGDNTCADSDTAVPDNIVEDGLEGIESDLDENEVSEADNEVKTEEALEADETTAESAESVVEPVQKGPFIDLFGPQLLSLEIIDETHAQFVANYTNEVLSGKKVVGIYFSADWCGPCVQFTPELSSFYKKMNNRRGKKDQFEIVWVSRCRDVQSYGQYFTHMGGWYALPPDEAMGQRGENLSQKFKVKGIPHLVLLDDIGNVITYEGRTKIPEDKAGIGFPWRNPISSVYSAIVPKSFRVMIKSEIAGIKNRIIGKLGSLIGLKRKQQAA